MKSKILIAIILVLVLVATNGTSADVPHALPAKDERAERVDKKTPENDAKESAPSAESVLLESQPGAESVPKAESEANPDANTDKPEEIDEGIKSAEDQFQEVEQPMETESEEDPGKTSASTKSEPEPEKGAQGETATESKPEEEKSQTADKEAEPKPEVLKELDEIVPLYVRKLVEMESGHNDSNPVWSPSGKRIAFERSIGDKREIIISGLNGVIVQKIYNKLSDQKNEEMNFFFPGIAEDISYNSGISWSPAEESLVFMSNGGSGNYDLYLLPQLGSEKTIRLTDADEKDSHSQWSPVADHLIFVSGRTGKANIFLMKLETKETIQLTDGEKTYLYPQWSPDGKKIAMIYGSNENHDIYLIEDITRPAETLKTLTTWPYDDLRPVWSPDGKKIAFYSNYNPQEDPKVWALFVIAADGSDPTEGEGLIAKVVATNVTPDIESGPAWLPDSKRIIYIKNDKQAYNPIYIVNVDEKADARLKTTTKMNHDVTSSSDGTIAFRAQIEQWDQIYIAILPN
jgi:Tol biopolymer transport system component